MEYFKDDTIYEEVKESNSLYNNINETIRMLNEQLKHKNNKKIKEIYSEYQYQRDEKLAEKNKYFIEEYKKHNDNDKFRKETIKQVEKYLYDYYTIIKDVF